MAAASPVSTSTVSFSSSAGQRGASLHAEKRRKITRACDNCKAKKKRCTGTLPCPSCEKAAKPCTYLASYTRGRFTTPPSSRGLDALVLAAESHDAGFSGQPKRSLPSQTPHAASTSPSINQSHPLSPSQSRGRSSADFTSACLPSPEQVLAQATTTVFAPYQRVVTDNFGPQQERTLQQPGLPVSEQWRPPGPQGTFSKDASGRASPEPDGTFDGQYLGPSSGIAWLRRAWRKLGQVRSLEEASEAGSPSYETPEDVTIFTHGDKPAPTALGPGLVFPTTERADYLVGRYFEFATPTYRFLHRPTLESWVSEMHSSNAAAVHPARQAVVLVILAIATLYDISRLKEPHSALRKESEMYYREAQSLLAKERGPAILESVQARFALCHYLLSTARSNQTWFTFGTTVQLAMALGLHRKRTLDAQQASLIVRETQRRLFWSMYTLDRYLSVMFGRPKLLQDDDISQELPLSVNDEDLSATSITSPGRDDCLEDAAIFHSQLTRILGRAAKEQYSIHRKSDAERIAAAAALNRDLANWRARLPPFLSGAIKPSSLIPIFRRQSMVLTIAHAHAVMLVNRPFLLSNLSREQQQQQQQNPNPAAALAPAPHPSHAGPSPRDLVATCLSGAKTALEMTQTFVREAQPFASFWFAQYIAFSGLAIVYLHLLQCARQGEDVRTAHRELLELADKCLRHLADVTEQNAPSMRYSIILDELREELARVLDAPRGSGGGGGGGGPTAAASAAADAPTQWNDSSAALPPVPAPGERAAAITTTRTTTSTLSVPAPASLPIIDGAGADADAQLDADGEAEVQDEALHMDWNLDFWPQLDSLPLSYSNWNEALPDLGPVPSG